MIVCPDNPRDRALFAALPVVLAPRFEPLPALELGRTRLVLASDGLYVEARTRVLHACGRIAQSDHLPFGRLKPFVMRLLDADPAPILATAAAAARRALPNEWAGVIVGQGNEFSLYEPPVLAQSSARVRYDATGIDPLNVLWDVHSHATMPAFFSGQDDADDLACPSPCFVAGVIGRCHTDTPTWDCRVIIAGRAFDLGMTASGRHLASPTACEKLAA